MSHSATNRFQEVFRSYYPEVLRKIHHLVGDRAAAEDLAQEVFLRLYRSPPEDETKLGSWLQRVLTRIVWDYYRKHGREEALADKQRNQLATQEQAYPPSEDAVIRDWEKDVVRRVLGKLSDRDRQALLLHEQGYSHREIADKLSVNPKIVGTLIHRAIGRFKQNIHAEEALDK